MNPLTGILRCMSLTHIVVTFSLLVREENLITCRFNDLFTPNKAENYREELEAYLHGN
jgi:hypothetical protein